MLTFSMCHDSENGSKYRGLTISGKSLGFRQSSLLTIGSQVRVLVGSPLFFEKAAEPAAFSYLQKKAELISRSVNGFRDLRYETGLSVNAVVLISHWNAGDGGHRYNITSFFIVILVLFLKRYL